MDMTDSIAPKSDQINADDLISGPVTVTIEGDSRGSDQQPFNFHLLEFPGRAYRPSKTMRRVMVAGWGPETDNYVGRRLTLYREPTIAFGGKETGGIRIAAMSHIGQPLKIALTVKRGQRDAFIVEPLTEAAPSTSSVVDLTARIALMIDKFQEAGVTLDQMERRIGLPRDQWVADDITAMTAVYQQLKAGTSKDELFPMEA